MIKNYKVNEYLLDENQIQLLNKDTNSLVIAGAGSGKTLTIIGKINYLIEKQNIKEEEILIISFTNNSVNDLKEKIKYNVNIFTFHKLAMYILEKYNLEYSIINTNSLNYIIKETLINNNINNQNAIKKYLKFNNYNDFLKSNNFNYFCNFIETFINLYKTNDLTKEDIFKIKYNKIEKQILIIIFQIYEQYLIEKKSINALDFDDLIKYATNYVNKLNLKFKYIIIDEFQDTSMLRLNLIKEIYKNTNSKIIVVGDDYQSIYHFSGCDLNIFLNFKNYFPNVNTIPLINTYRNSQELINIASKFIMKNKNQINKELKSKKHNNNPIILCPYNNEKEILKNILDNLYNYEDIMILSRNNNDIYNYLSSDLTFEKDYILYKNKKMKYLTVHKSKGLEANYIIVLNCNNNKTGFPNKIENNKIIDKLFLKEKMLYAEERRLFYVALTRCKEQTFLLYNKNNPSIFIKEIKKLLKKSKLKYK